MQATVSSLSSVSTSTSFVKTGEPTDVTLKCTDQYGNEINDDNITVSVKDNAGTYENGKLTATADGAITLNVTLGSKTIETTVYAISNAPELTLDKSNYEYFGIYGSPELDNSEFKGGWESRWVEYTNAGEMTIGNTPVMQTQNAKTILLGKSDENGNVDQMALDNNGYTTLEMSIFSDRDAEINVTTEINGGSAETKTVEIKGGKWNTVTLNTAEITSFKYIKLFDAKCADGTLPNMLITNVYLSKRISAETPVLTSVKSDVVFVREGEATNLRLTCLDQNGKEIDNAVFTVRSDDGSWDSASNLFTATKSGNINITILSDENTVGTLSLYAVNKEATPTLDADKYVYQGIYCATPFDANNNNVSWHTPWGDDKVLDGEIAIANTPAKQILDFKKTYICKINGDDVNGAPMNMANNDGYTNVVMSVLPDRDVTVQFLVEATTGNAIVNDIALKAGVWNTVSASGFTTSTVFNYIELILNDGNERPNLLISNVCLRKSNPNNLVINRDEPDNKGFVRVEGKLSTPDQLDEIQSKDMIDITAFDLSNVTFGEGISSLDVANKNAMILVQGTVENNIATIAESAKAIEGTDNLVVKDAQGYLFPVNTIHLTDGYLAYTTYFVSTHDTGYDYTRNVTVNDNNGKWISITSPVEIDNIPEGITVYEGNTAETEENVLSFNRVDRIEKHTPYIAYATSDVTLFGSATGDLDMRSENLGSVKLGNVVFHGAYAPVSGEGHSYYGLYRDAQRADSKLTLQRVGDNATLGSFRAYFEIPEGTKPEALKVKVNNGIETAILNIQTTDNTSATGVYSLDGRLIKPNGSTVGLQKGVYIINGKKVVVR